MSIGLASAQTKVFGVVLSAEDGQPVIGASIKVKGVNVGTVTDTDGKFSLSVPASGKTLVVSYVGMESQELAVKSSLRVVLKGSAQSLGEVVVTGALGIKRQAREVGYAATTIGNKLLTQANTTNVQQALTGKISGLNITTTNSGVFQNARINIRGIRSLTGNNQPMLIVDDSPVSLSYLSSISPADIKEMTILKSGASAAIYGPEAVNGVIVITTKKGDTDKTTVSLTSSAQMTRVSYLPKIQKEFGAGAGETQDDFGNYLYVPYENQMYGPRFDGSMQDIGVKLQDGSIQRGPYDNSRYQDKIDFWNTGFTLQNNVSITGKGFKFGISNDQVKGLMPNDKRDRTVINFAADKEYGNLKVSYTVNYTNSNSDVVNEGAMPDLTQSSYTGSILSQIMQIPNNVPLSEYKDWKNGKWGRYENYFNEFAINPYWIVDNLRTKLTGNELIGNVKFEYKIAPWLKADLKASSTFANAYSESRMSPIEKSDVSDWTIAHRDNTSYHRQPGAVTNLNGFYTMNNVDAFLSGSQKATEDLKVSYLVGTNLKTQSSNYLSVKGNDLVVPYLYNLSVRSGDAEIGNGLSQIRQQAVYGSFSLGYKNLAFIEFTGRNDWDSRLLKENRSFFYPGVNASLMMSDIIPQLKDLSVNKLKLRGSYTKSANVNIAPYSLQATYTPGVGFPFGSTQGFSANNVIPDVNLKPEFVAISEVGFDLGLMEDRVALEASYFYQNSTNQILSSSQSWATGFPVALSNAASFKNYGVEMELSLTPLVKIGRGDFNFSVNATYNNNEVTETAFGNPVVLTGNAGFIQNSSSNPTVNNIAMVGQPAFAFQLTDYDRDPQGRVIIDKSTGYPTVAANMVVKGRTLPLWIIGMTPSYKIGNFEASMTWDFKGGHDFYAGQGSDMDFSGISVRSTEYGRQRFVFPNSVYADGTNADGSVKYVPNTNILVQDGNYGFWTGKKTNLGIATNYFASAATWRLREVNLTYTFPAKLLKNLSVVKNASLSLIGKDLLMFVPSSNQWGDPEFNYTNTGNTFGISSPYQTPPSRYFGATLNVKF
ncbi:MAG: SusC/RagA family TonB-linked outer membrane protein [Bacteroidales bacterium]